MLHIRDKITPYLRSEHVGFSQKATRSSEHYVTRNYPVHRRSCRNEEFASPHATF